MIPFSLNTVRRKLIFSSILLVLLINNQSLIAQRYLTEVFDQVQITSGITYGVNATVIAYSQVNQALPEQLKMDIYQPVGDSEMDRPLILYFHTGNFLPFPLNGEPVGTRKDSCVVEICSRFARMGYVVASCDYRLGWNPVATTRPERAYTFINALHRGVQDCRTAIRFMRKTAAEQGNLYRIDVSKIAVWGEGSGGYIALGAATLDNWLEDIALVPKFNWDPYGTGPIPMIIEQINGNADGTTIGINPNDGDTLSYPNHVGYSSAFNVMVNMGGALGDFSWLEDAAVPMISFHVPTDPYDPYNSSNMIFPTNNLTVLEVTGSYGVQQLAASLSNNDVFLNAETWVPGLSYTNTANARNEGYFGLYPFIRGGANIYDSSPWEWWDPTLVFSTNNDNGLITNPDMSAIKARAFIDTIQGYVAPRIMSALELPGGLGQFVIGCTTVGACNYNPLATVNDFSCAFTGAPCDDSDPCTFLDEIQPDCSCAGINTTAELFSLASSSTTYPDGSYHASFTISGPASVTVNYQLNGVLQSTALNTDGLATINITSVADSSETYILNLLSFETSVEQSCIGELALSDTLTKCRSVMPTLMNKSTDVSNCPLVPGALFDFYIRYSQVTPQGSTLFFSTNYPVSFNSPVIPSGIASSFMLTSGNYLELDYTDLFVIPEYSNLVLTLDSMNYEGCVSTFSNLADTTVLPGTSLSMYDGYYPNEYTDENGYTRVGCNSSFGYDYNLPISCFIFLHNYELNIFSQPPQNYPLPNYQADFFLDYDFEFKINDDTVHFNNFTTSMSSGLRSYAIADGVEYSLFLLGEYGPSIYISNACSLQLANDTIRIKPIAYTAPGGCRTEGFFLEFSSDYDSFINGKPFIIFPTENLQGDSLVLDCSASSIDLIGFQTATSNTWQGYYWVNSPLPDYDLHYYLGDYWLPSYYSDTLSVNQPGIYSLITNDYESCQYYQKEFTVTALAGTPCDDGNECTINDLYDENCTCAGTYVDSDNDGACDAIDPCPTLPPVGTACDDGDEATINDVYRPACLCAGVLPGCANANACNYNPLAESDDGTCLITGDTCDDMNAQTINDAITSDCSCMGQLTGCIDSNACNFNSAAEVSDGSCVYPGCMDNSACNFNSQAGCDDGSCTFAGCMDPQACNYDASAGCDDGSCEEVIAYEIVGPQLPVALDTIFYSYTTSSGSIYQWTAVGGIVLVPDDVAEVVVVWAEEGIGQLCVQETDAEGCVGPNVCLDIIVILSSNFEEELSGVMLFPNPTKSAAYVDVNADWMQSQLTVVSVIGEVVLSKQIQSYRTELNLEDFASGLYLVQLKGKDGSARALRLVVE